MATKPACRTATIRFRILIVPTAAALLSPTLFGHSFYSFASCNCLQCGTFSIGAGKGEIKTHNHSHDRVLIGVLQPGVVQDWTSKTTPDIYDPNTQNRQAPTSNTFPLLSVTNFNELKPRRRTILRPRRKEFVKRRNPRTAATTCAPRSLAFCNSSQ